MNKTEVYYAVYKGDKFICQGNKFECAKYLNVKPDTISFKTTPTYKKRMKATSGNNYMIVIKVDDI